MGGNGLPQCCCLSLAPCRAPTLNPPPRPPQSWFTEADLAVGRVLELHGRRFRITGADQFTEQYRAVHG